MKVLILSPSIPPETTGNAVSSGRLLGGLKEKAVEAELLRSSPNVSVNRLTGFSPDIIHAFHALKSGPPALELSQALSIPLVVTLTGTDLNEEENADGNSLLEKVLDDADALIVFSDLTRERVLSVFPGLGNKVRIIRPSVEMVLSKEDGDLQDALKPTGSDILLPSGIRPVKVPCFAIGPLERLKETFPDLGLTVAGPRLDEDEWGRFRSMIRQRSWISHKTVIYEEMPGLYLASDIVLNTSRSEGLSNALLEAMYMGKAILASDCEGNSSLICHGRDGLLYRSGDEEDFSTKASMLLENRDLRSSLGREAALKVRSQYSLESEVNNHIALYESLIRS